MKFIIIRTRKYLPFLANTESLEIELRCMTFSSEEEAAAWCATEDDSWEYQVEPARRIKHRWVPAIITK